MITHNDIYEIPRSQFGTNLSHIHTPPKSLYVRGNSELLESSDLKICIIGSRTHTEYGRRVTLDIIKTLAPYHPIIISGLATGIDSHALTYALTHHLRCIAVLGSGLCDDVIYPQSNVGLAHQIVAAGGALISEYGPEVRAQKWSFPLRNRIMAGLSDSIVIVEGGIHSGTLITARLGLEFGRTIISVPGSIFSQLSAGPLSLIEQGAIPLTSPNDILRIHNLSGGQLLLRDETSYREQYTRCTPEERTLLDQLGHEMQRDELLRALKWSPDRFQIVLVTLEIKGLIHEKYGYIYATSP